MTAELTNGERARLATAVDYAVERIARERAGVPDDGPPLSEDQQRAIELAKVTALREVAPIQRMLLDETTQRAALFGASGPEIAAAASLGGTAQAHKKWPMLGKHIRERRWLVRNGERLISDIHAFLALADRMGLPDDVHFRLGNARRSILEDRLSSDICALRFLVVAHIRPLLSQAGPDPEDMEAVAVLSRLRALTEDYRLSVSKPPKPAA